MILAPLRGVTVRAFREVFADCLVEAGFTEAFTPFITAIAGFDPLKDRELSNRPPVQSANRTIPLTPQFIGKDPEALRQCLLKVKAAGFATADLNCGCPFPMVRNKGRGSGLLSTPEVFERMLAVGCETMGPGCFSVKARLGVSRADELLKLMPVINRYPLRFLTVHGRVAKQMYEGAVDWNAVSAIAKVAKVPIVLNGDLPFETAAATASFRLISPPPQDIMVGRAFIRALGERGDIAAFLQRYVEVSRAELFGDRPVLGRIKELVAYWKDSPRWRRRWNVVKLARTIPEFATAFDGLEVIAS